MESVLPLQVYVCVQPLCGRFTLRPMSNNRRRPVYLVLSCTCRFPVCHGSLVQLLQLLKKLALFQVGFLDSMWFTLCVSCPLEHAINNTFFYLTVRGDEKYEHHEPKPNSFKLKPADEGQKTVISWKITFYKYFRFLNLWILVFFLLSQSIRNHVLFCFFNKGLNYFFFV